MTGKNRKPWRCRLGLHDWFQYQQAGDARPHRVCIDCLAHQRFETLVVLHQSYKRWTAQPPFTTDDL